ncbi:hypothetical protein P7K49_027670 [Saguinus oedipus]|uniref:G-patch domain-containing protein n=1 Tax=Saguinus oedipus TaxID=9490 RepID=A0ABQ9UA36_SAGOE|nr:hypothetical protein P7K49_027670 [Saguinus oedipus]
MQRIGQGRRKQKWAVDPQNTAWSNDDSKFGQRMLEKMGWSKGKGLGAQEQGATDHIKVQVKNNHLGLGASINNEDNWIAHQDDFNQLLAELNACHGQETTGREVSLLIMFNDMIRWERADGKGQPEWCIHSDSKHFQERVLMSKESNSSRPVRAQASFSLSAYSEGTEASQVIVLSSEGREPLCEGYSVVVQDVASQSCLPGLPIAAPSWLCPLSVVLCSEFRHLSSSLREWLREGNLRMHGEPPVQRLVPHKLAVSRSYFQLIRGFVIRTSTLKILCAIGSAKEKTLLVDVFEKTPGCPWEVAAEENVSARDTSWLTFSFLSEEFPLRCCPQRCVLAPLALPVVLPEAPTLEVVAHSRCCSATHHFITVSHVFRCLLRNREQASLALSPFEERANSSMVCGFFLVQKTSADGGYLCRGENVSRSKAIFEVFYLDGETSGESASPSVVRSLDESSINCDCAAFSWESCRLLIPVTVWAVSCASHTRKAHA